jgi:hypothetical protein
MTVKHIFNIHYFSEDVAVPVALGHYDDKLQLLEKIAHDAPKLSGPAMTSSALKAAEQQFISHARDHDVVRSDVVKVILLVSNGETR